MSYSDSVYAYYSNRKPTNAAMSCERVYAASCQNMPAITKIASILSIYNPLDVSVNPESESKTLRLIALKHFLSQMLNTKPENLGDFFRLRNAVKEQLSEIIYDSSDREKILNQCFECWQEELLPTVASLSAESIKFKLRPLFDTETLINLGFVLQHLGKNTIQNRNLSWKDFMIYKIAPIMINKGISPSNQAAALKLIHVEFKNIKLLLIANPD